MKNTLTNHFFRACIFGAALLGAPNLFAVVGFTVSPSAVSNTYYGPISLVVTGLTTGASVVVQKFADYNTNGVIDASDGLFQQFTLTDGQAGMVINGVTNLNVPGDTDTTAGKITAQLNFGPDFIQTFVGKYLFKLSSSTGQFAPTTNTFSVTNFPFPQKFTGTVQSGGVAVPYGIVILFPPPRAGNHGPGNPEGETVANSAGGYTLAAAPGAYTLVTFKTNFVGNFNTAPVLTLSNNATINTNLSLTPATLTISGKVEDAANSSIGVPGLFVAAQTQSTGAIGSGFTDTNGNYSIKVTANQWGVQPVSGAPTIHGYVSLQGSANADTTGGNVANVNIALPKATALFYGTVLDGQGSPLPKINVYAQDNADGGGTYQADGYTDSNGNYVTAVVGGLGANDPWSIQVDNGGGSSNPTNYIYSQSPLQQNGGTNLNAGNVVLQNFTALLATNHITGHIQTSSGRSITNVQVSANANINGQNYGTQVDSDTSGNYSLPVADGDWNGSLNCNSTGNGDSLDEILGPGTYVCPSGAQVTIADSNVVVNVSVTLCGAVQVDTTTLPDGQVNVSYFEQLYADSCNANFVWSTNSGGSLPSGLTLDPSGFISGTPDTAGTNHFSVHVVDGNNNFTNQALTLVIDGAPLQITSDSTLPNGGHGSFYTQTLQAIGGQTPYLWSVPNYSQNPPPNLALSPSGTLSGTLATNGTLSFYARVTDATNGTFDQQFFITITNLPLQVFTFQLPNGTVGASYSAQLVATNGQPPYSWGYASGSALLPANLSLAPSGLISGVPATNGLFSFIVQVTDSSFAANTKVLGLIINPKPKLGSVGKSSGTQFQFLLTGVSNQNYTVQVSTNLNSVNWTTLVVTNSTTANSFQVVDPHATNPYRYYRVLIGP